MPRPTDVARSTTTAMHRISIRRTRRCSEPEEYVFVNFIPPMEKLFYIIARWSKFIKSLSEIL